MTSKLPRKNCMPKIIVFIASLLVILLILITTNSVFFKFVTTVRNDIFFENKTIQSNFNSTTGLPDETSRLPLGNIQPVEYVTPVKVYSTSLHEDDILFTQHVINENVSQDENEVFNHNSGTFRHNKAIIWDPHPEYKFKAFGKDFHLVLKHDSDFVSPNIKVLHISRNYSIQREPNIKPNGCFYSGFLKGDIHSHVVVSLCNGMTGHISTSDASYMIEPVDASSKDNTDTFLHVIYKVYTNTEETSPIDATHCALQEEDNVNTTISDMESPAVVYDNEPITMEDHIRKKRSLSLEYVVELMIVADHKMVRYHGPGLENYILTLMSIVAKIYKDKSIGNPMHIAVVKFVTLNDGDMINSNTAGGSTSPTQMLEDFCRWQARMKNIDDSARDHHDCALLLTRERICLSHNQPKCNNTLGIAHLGTMCQKNSCAIVRDNGLSAAFTIAHELGHVLNMPHDDEIKCNNYKEEGSKQCIMSRVLDQNAHPWTWSPCSRHYLTEYLDAGYGECLRNGALTDILTDNNNNLVEKLPGENYTTDKQCELFYGYGSRICSDMDVCHSLWCTREYVQDNSCRTHHMPWAEGTPCGSNHWCQRGQCVLKDRHAIEPMDGEWGPWQPFGECSRTCGGGVKKAIRECDNPSPSNGGRYCIGKRVKYLSCSTDSCPPGTMDFRSEQCARFNNNNFNLHNLTGNIRWIPKYGARDNDRCKLYCRLEHSGLYYQLQDKVIDGTPCSPDTYDMCVNGICEIAGCDHILGSSSKLDVCGICGGNNSSCKPVYNRYNTIPKYGYNYVTKIPAGSSNLDIRQHGLQAEADDNNYLALLDADTGKYILNGGFVVSPFKKMLFFEGIKLEYSGSHATVERINSSQPLNKDIVVELLSVGKLYLPDIDYRYTIPTSPADYFKWEVTNEWTRCNKVCRGEQEKVVRCMKNDRSQYVSDESCDGLIKPVSESRSCNLDCVLKWKASSQSECSSQCGPGTRLFTFQCIQQFSYSSLRASNLPASSCSHIAKPSETQPCTGSCKEAHWIYSEWKPCSVSCGSGVQTRTAECVDQLDRQTDESRCMSSEKILEKVCNLDKCAQWSVGEWSHCSVTCGVGEKRRSVLCQQGNRVVSSSLCPSSTTPPHVEKCHQSTCATWETGDWSQCSVTCGVGVMRRRVRCSKSNECSMSNKPAESEICIFAACSNDNHNENEIPNVDGKHKYIWRAGDWSSCSSSCDFGRKSRDVKCYDKITGQITSHSNCEEREKPSNIEGCYSTCGIWKTSEWSACSATCGRGVSRRKVTCISSTTRNEVPHSECKDTMPESTVQCQASRNCVENNAVYKWRTGIWGECSSSCGGGMKLRAVACQDETGAFCDHCDGPKPDTSIRCNIEPCPSQVYWKYGDWSECKGTCNVGYQHRQAMCRNLDGETISNDYCSRYEDAKTLQKCDNSNCIVYKWKTSSWSECSASCGNGVETRNIECRKIDKRNEQQDRDVVVEENYCKNEERPMTERSCQLEACPEILYSWVPGVWGDCSQPCGKKGRQTRRLFCYHKDGVKVSRKYCKTQAKPTRKRKCNQRKCGFTTCLEIREKLSEKLDREYTLNILGRNITIYCHNMSSSPIEYLTLPMGESENYSEFYEKRLVVPEQCPYGGIRNPNCHCIPEESTNAGMTAFSKIRINITTLVIDTRDFTFSRQIKGKRIGFAEAGDCYSSSAICPQGKFSLDLTGTGLRISPSTSWVASGILSSKRINKLRDSRKVVGLCGGYCGTCRPESQLKLDVLPP